VPANLSRIPPADPTSSPARRDGRRLIPVPTQRTVAKGGMAVSLGVLVWSALAGRHMLRRYHVLAGVALLGFTAWHMTLYKARDTGWEPAPRKRESPAKAPGRT
jgi:hypothetical protein